MRMAHKIFSVIALSLSIALSATAAETEKAGGTAQAASAKSGAAEKKVQRRVQQAPADEKAPEVPMPAFALDRYCGDYTNDAHGTVKVAKRGDLLVLSGGAGDDSIELRHWDGHKFKGYWRFLTLNKDAGYVTFAVGPAGEVSGVDVGMLGSGMLGSFRKVRSEAKAEPVPAGSRGRDKVLIDGMKVVRQPGGPAAADKAPLGSKRCEFDKLCDEAVVVNGVKRITYEQFQRLRASGDKYVLVDVLSSDDYRTGHIPGAISFPLNSINLYNSANKIPVGSRVVVYCLDSGCPYSDDAARKLSGFGYTVLAYKGGLDEWQQKGQRVERD
jgi:rhodanese-related sulfurtransferase